ncbi:MAG: hypothetical protein IJH37_01625 [Clostridia bacterium]|nr:hypothetical protein [Clostridia bacterium]
MKEKSSGLGSIIYAEWLLPIQNYYASLRKNECTYEVLSPIFIAILSVCLYYVHNKVELALDKLSDILPTAVSILIGFTAMLITILLTSTGENVEKLKSIKCNNKLNGNDINLFQKLHIQLSHILFSEIILILIIFLYLFISGLYENLFFACIVLFFAVYLTLNILLSILRGVTNIYFSFYNTQKDKNIQD